MNNIDAQLLDRLLQHRGFITLDALHRAIDRPIKYVTTQLSSMHRAGCVFDHHPHDGVQLIEAGLGVWVDYLQWALQRKVQVYMQTASTQNAVRDMLDAGGTGGTTTGGTGGTGGGGIVAADSQAAGRGRLGRKWVDDRGAALLFSFAYHSDASVDRIMLGSAVAVAVAIELLSGLRVAIRWPNDVLIGNQKLAGILVERVDAAGKQAVAIIGIGVNVKRVPDEFADTATCLAQHGANVDRLLLLCEIVQQFERVMTLPLDELVRQWRARNVLGAMRMGFICDGKTVHGQVVDIDPHDGLIVRTDAGAVVHLPGATTSLVQG